MRILTLRLNCTDTDGAAAVAALVAGPAVATVTYQAVTILDDRSTVPQWAIYWWETGPDGSPTGAQTVEYPADGAAARTRAVALLQQGKTIRVGGL